jgi:hypothetical protein
MRTNSQTGGDVLSAIITTHQSLAEGENPARGERGFQLTAMGPGECRQLGGISSAGRTEYDRKAGAVELLGPQNPQLWYVWGIRKRFKRKPRTPGLARARGFLWVEQACSDAKRHEMNLVPAGGAVES